MIQVQNCKKVISDKFFNVNLLWGHSLHCPWPTTLKKPGAQGIGGTIGSVPLVHWWPPGHGEQEAELL